MVECEQSSSSALKRSEFDSERRVIHSLKKFTNDKNQKQFVASSATYSSNQMDGRISVFSVAQLLEQESSAQNTASQERPKVPAMQFFESQTACGDSTIVKVEGKHYLVSGFDDGVVCLVDLARTNGKSVYKPVFKTENDSGASSLD